ncbi:MAG: hypothetical protein K2K51_00970, partial [Bacteroidales bacterium]|nr:hypothetical protein [Bacteroidales bacterium]
PLLRLTRSASVSWDRRCVYEKGLNMFLLENKIPTPLIPTEDCDYFLLACGEVDHYDFGALTELIESMESIFSVYPIDVKRHETLQNFFLEDDRFPKI